LDQITKCGVARNIKASDPLIIFENFFEITYVLNPGAAFGFLANSDSSITHPFFIIVTSAAVLLITYMFFTLQESDRLGRISLCLILSGAIGNFIDRLWLGAVIDFIYVHYYNYYWPAFNVADAYITIGVFLYAVDVIIMHKKEGETVN
jgi:signal peptidase II